MIKFFKKKLKEKGLEQAKNEGLITEKEFFRLKVERAEEEEKNFLSKKVKKSKKKK